MTEKLLSCPFCGSSATMEQTDDNRWSVGCDSADELMCMGNQSFATFSRQVEARDAWNKRTSTELGTAATDDARILAAIRTRGNPYPMGSEAFEAFENGRRPAFDLNPKPEPFILLHCLEARQCKHIVCICEGDPTLADVPSPHPSAGTDALPNIVQRAIEVWAFEPWRSKVLPGLGARTCDELAQALSAMTREFQPSAATEEAPLYSNREDSITTKSAPERLTSQHAEMLPQREPAAAGADTQWAEIYERGIRDLSAAAEALLATTPSERHDPKIWFGRVDVLKLAIRVANSIRAAPQPSAGSVCCYCDAPLCCAACGREQPDDSADLPQGAPDLSKVLESCKGEHLKFEEWAASEKYDMHEHPLHYLFMDAKTNAARQGWKAALRYVEDALALTRPNHLSGDEA